MFHRLIAPVAALVLAWPFAPVAHAGDDLDTRIFAALGLPEMIGIMRDEGLAYADQISQDMFPDRISAEWPRTVAAIYDVDRMRTAAETGMSDALASADRDAILAFFMTEPGKTFVQLEIAARRALLDDAVEEMSKEAAAIDAMDETPRNAQLQRFVEINDLVETNVVGALNSNYAFYVGLMKGGAFGADLTEAQILSDVWTQEPDIRANTTEWVYSFLNLAYQPASDADLDTYIAFSESPAGRDLNRALFSAFDGLFEDISRELGVASAQQMLGADL